MSKVNTMQNYPLGVMFLYIFYYCITTIYSVQSCVKCIILYKIIIYFASCSTVTSNYSCQINLVEEKVQCFSLNCSGGLV